MSDWRMDVDFKTKTINGLVFTVAEDDEGCWLTVEKTHGQRRVRVDYKIPWGAEDEFVKYIVANTNDSWDAVAPEMVCMMITGEEEYVAKYETWHEHYTTTSRGICHLRVGWMYGFDTKKVFDEMRQEA